MLANLKDWYRNLVSPAFLTAVAIYGTLLVLLSATRPFWVDELLQLFGTRDLADYKLLRYVGTFPGAAPIGYFAQHWITATVGFSPVFVRLSSTLPCLLGCVCARFLLRQLRIQDRCGIAILCWMLLPIQLRYGVEARPYALALLFSIVATILFFRFLARPSYANGVFYCVSVLLAIYTAPYTLFLQAGYVVWAMFFQKNRTVRVISATALAVAGLGFSPWYWASINYWKHYLAVTADVGFHVTWKFVLLPIQEISGGGYLCSIPLLFLSAIGYRSRHLSRPLKNCLLLGILSGFAGAFATDLTFGYFFAIRQVLFILVPLILLTAAGIEDLLEHKRMPLHALLILLLIGSSFVKDVRYFSDTSENWSAAAATLKAAVATGACLKFVGADDPRYYTFFESSLSNHVCSSPVDLRQSIVVPFTRYTALQDLEKTRSEFSRLGYKTRSSVQSGGATVAIYSHR